MKKFLYISSMLISILIFFICFSISSLTNVMYNQFTAPTNYLNVEGKETLSVYFSDLKAEDKLDVYETLVNIASEHNFSFIVSHTTTVDLLNKTDHYLYTKDVESFSELYLTGDTLIDFTKDTDGYYTTNQADPYAINYIDYVDTRLRDSQGKDTTSIHPFSQVKKLMETEDSLGLLLACDDPDQAIQILKESDVNQYLNITSLNQLDMSHVHKVETVLFEVDDEMKYNYALTTITFVLFLLLLFQYISHRKKDISVQRLLGISVKEIIQHMFLKSLSLCVLLYTGCQVILFMMFCQSMRPVNLSLRLWLLYFLGLFILVLVCFYIISFIFIHKLKVVNGMKQHKINNSIINASLILKAVVTMIIIVPFMETEAFVTENFENFSALFTRKAELSQYAHISTFAYGNDVEENDLTKQTLYTILNQHGAMFCDFDSYMGSFVDMKDEKDIQYPYIHTNQNFLQQYALYDTTGNKVNLSEIKEPVVFVPESAKDIDLNQLTFFSYNGEELIYIKDSGKIYSLLPIYYTASDPLVVKNPIMKYIPTNDVDTNMINQYTIYINTADEQEYQATIRDLEQAGLSSTVTFVTNKTMLEDTISYYTNTLLNFVLMVIVYLITYLSMLYLNVSIYLHEYKGRLALHYLHGHSFFYRYGKIMLCNGLVYLVPLAISVSLMSISFLHALGYLCFFALIELCMELHLIHKFHKQGVIRVLKGD